MASFSAKQLDISKVNDGQQFINGVGITATAMNSIVEGILFAENNGGGGGDISFSPTDKGKFLVVGDDGKVIAQSIQLGDNIYYG
jgi:hypothetical protein